MIVVEFDNGFAIKCDLVLSYSKKIAGLKSFSSLPEGHGLWFTFDTPGYYMFWNKDVDFPIDLLFLRDMEVNTIASLDADSSKIVMPSAKSDFVIEVNRGELEKGGLSVGSKIVKIKNE